MRTIIVGKGSAVPAAQAPQPTQLPPARRPRGKSIILRIAEIVVEDIKNLLYKKRRQNREKYEEFKRLALAGNNNQGDQE